MNGKYDARLVTGLIMFGFMVAVAVFAPLIARNDPLAIDLTNQFVPPSADHWFGTASLGFDVFARVVYAARHDLLIAVSAVALSIAIGHPIGLLVGYVGGWGDSVTMRFLDVIQAFPALVLAIGVLSALGQGVRNLILVIGIVGVPTFVRLVRAEVRSLREHAYVEAGRAVGNSRSKILWRYIAPGTVGTVVTQAAISCGWAILLAAALGFIGLGVPLPEPEWGAMIAEGIPEDEEGRQLVDSGFPGYRHRHDRLLPEPHRRVGGRPRGAHPEEVTMSALLEVRGLEVGIGGLPILRGVDMEVRPGEILGVVGETGAGKSMTARSVLDLLPARRHGRLRVLHLRRAGLHPPEGPPGSPRPPDRFRAPAAPRQPQPGVPGRQPVVRHPPPPPGHGQAGGEGRGPRPAPRGADHRP